MAEEKEIDDMISCIDVGSKDHFKEIMDLFQSKGYITHFSYLEKTDDWVIDLYGIPGIKSFSVNHPVYDFFQELTERKLITISDGKKHYTDRAENHHVNVRPIPIRIKFNLDSPIKKTEFYFLLRGEKTDILQVSDLSKHIKEWKDNIVERSEEFQHKPENCNYPIRNSFFSQTNHQGDKSEINIEMQDLSQASNQM